MNDPTERPSPGQAARRMIFRIAILAGLIVVTRWTLGHVMPRDAVGALTGENMRIGLLILTLAAYVLLLAIPFVPAVEIGLALLFFGGPIIAPYVYIATVAGLMMAYLVGRWIPYAWLHGLFADLRLRRLCDLLDTLAPLSQEERLTLLNRRLPRWAAPLADWGRYVAFALLLAVPGNMLIGGGGGIALLAGMSRLFATPIILLTISLAVLPVPFMVWAFDADLSLYF